jgi:lambda family phage minor tail protein L
MAVPFSDLQQAAPSAIIELFQLELNTAQHGADETYYFHAGVGFSIQSFTLTEDNYYLLLEDESNMAMENNYFSDIVWDGQSYLRFPIEVDGFEWNGTGQLPRPTLRVSNIFGTITGLILSLPRGLEGAKVTRIRTLLRYLDDINFPGGTSPYTPDPTAEFPQEIYYVDRKAKETRDLIELELAAVFDLVNVRAPKRQCSNFCPWEYRGAECNYTGTAFFNENDEVVPTLAEDKCGKRISSCTLRFGQTVAQGTVVINSPIPELLVLDEPVETIIGAPIKGFGVVDSTTVSSIAGNVITMSQPATASSFVSGTGTLNASTRRSIGFFPSSPSGLQKGMLVAGPNITPGTTIEGFEFLAVLLSQPVPWDALKTVVVSHAGILRSTDEAYQRGRKAAPSSGFILSVSSVASVAVGQFVIGPGIPASANAKVVAKYSNGNYWDSDLGYSAWIELSYEANLDGSSGTYTFYTVPLQAPQTYTFTAPDRSYTFKDGGVINFGGFPGIGSYYA